MVLSNWSHACLSGALKTSRMDRTFPNSGQRIKSLVHFKSRDCPGYSHGELVVSIGSRVSRKTASELRWSRSSLSRQWLSRVARQQ